VLKDYLETQEIDPQYFYFIIFGLKILCAEAFPGFTVEDYEDLEFIPRPHSHDWESIRKSTMFWIRSKKT
jgi:hypothetical protein